MLHYSPGKCIGVGAQLTLGGKEDIFHQNYVWIFKKPEFYVTIARKKYQIAPISTIFAPKNNKIPEFYMIFARKYPNSTR